MKNIGFNSGDAWLGGTVNGTAPGVYNFYWSGEQQITPAFTNWTRTSSGDGYEPDNYHMNTAWYSGLVRAFTIRANSGPFSGAPS